MGLLNARREYAANTMTDYGEFVSRGPYTSGALSSVEIATAKAGKPGSFALKRFHPPASRQIRRVLQLEAWRLSMELQQRVAVNHGAALEVVAVGSSPDGEFAVLPWNRRSLTTIINSVSPTGNRLRALASGLLTALRSWEHHSGRPHGNLKASNVFVVGDGALPSVRFILSDPSWVLSVPAARLRRQELAQLGEIIVQMVRKREAGEVPLEHAPEWDRLGRGGAAWREFCDFLLDPHSDPAGVTLEAAGARLRAIQTDFRPERVTINVGVGLVLVVGSGLVGYAKLGEPSTMPEGLLWLAEKTGNAHSVREQTVPQWALLCVAWDDWVANLMAQSTVLEQNKDLWADSDSLKFALAEFRRKAEAFRPHALVPEDTGGRSYISLAQKPPATVRRERVVRHIEESWKAVSTLKEELEHWWRWPTLRSLHESLAVVGKKEALIGVQPLAPPPPSRGSGAEAQPFVLALTALSNDPFARLLSSQWADWSTTAVDLQKSGDRVQAAMPLLVLRSVSDTQDLAAFAGSLGTALRELRQRRTLFLRSTVARERFLKESPLLSEKGEVVPADLKRWEDEIAAFSHVSATEDPRSAIAWEARLTAMQSNAADLEDEIPVADATASTAGALLNRVIYTQEAERVRTEVTRLRSRDVIRREIPELTLQTSHAQANVVSLEERLEATLALLRPDRWLAGIATRHWPTDAARQRWEAWRRERLATAPASALEHDRTRFRSLRKEERALRDWLEALHSPSALGAEFSLQQVGVSTQRALATVMATFREKAAAAAISAAEWTGPLPRASFADTLSRQSAVRAVVDEYQKWMGELPAFASDLEGLGGLLAQGMSWAEGLAASFTHASSHRGAELLEGDPKRWLQSAQHLRELAEGNDPAVLATAITSGDLPTGLTAWKRLGELPSWPSDKTQLDQEKAFGQSLKERVGKLALGTRRETLSVQISAGQRERWLRAARSAVKQPIPEDSVFAQAQAFSVDIESLEPPMGFNLRLWQLNDKIHATDDLGELKIARDNFVSEVRKLTELSHRQTIDSFLKALEAEPLKADESSVQIRTPKQAKWLESPSEDGRRVKTTWSGAGRKVSLDYQLILPADNTAPFFLACRTIAVGDFIDLTTGHVKGPDVLNALPKWARGEGTPAQDNLIMAWKPREKGSGVTLNDSSWFYTTDPQMKEQLSRHPSELLPAIDTRPAWNSPLQYISPEVARLFAEKVLGARLPTPAEWNALCRGVQTPPEGNFRSSVYDTVLKYTTNYTVPDTMAGLKWRPDKWAFQPKLNPLNNGNSGTDFGRLWSTRRAPSLWPSPVDEGPVSGNMIHLFGNVWIYLLDEKGKEFYVAGGSILTPTTVNIRDPQRLVPLKPEVGGNDLGYGDGFADVGLRPAFDAPLSLRLRLQFARVARSQAYVVQ